MTYVPTTAVSDLSFHNSSTTAHADGFGNLIVGSISFGLSGPGEAPLQNLDVSAAVCANLDSDKLDGQHGSYYLDPDNFTGGTLPDAIFPATLPAISGANLTNLDASDLASGTIPTARYGTTVLQTTGAQTVTGSKTFEVASIYSFGAVSNVAIRNNVGGSTYAEILADMTLTWGPGGPRDTRLRRSGVGTLTLDNNAGGAATFAVTGAISSTGGVTVGTTLTLSGVASHTTVGAAGAASALPATPEGYIVVNIAGTNRKIAFYAV